MASAYISLSRTEMVVQVAKFQGEVSLFNRVLCDQTVYLINKTGGKNGDWVETSSDCRTWQLG